MCAGSKVGYLTGKSSIDVSPNISLCMNAHCQIVCISGPHHTNICTCIWILCFYRSRIKSDSPL